MVRSLMTNVEETSLLDHTAPYRPKLPQYEGLPNRAMTPSVLAIKKVDGKPYRLSR